jgi:hypothetical protein
MQCPLLLSFAPFESKRESSAQPRAHAGAGDSRKCLRREFRGIGRFWTYDPSANPTGLRTVDQDGILAGNRSPKPLIFYDRVRLAPACMSNLLPSNDY